MSDLTTIVPDDLPPPSIFDEFETDDNALENGKWFEDVGRAGSGIRVKLRSIQSKASMKSRQALNAKYRKFEKKGVHTDQMNERIINEQMADSVIVGWDGIRDRDGKAIEWSKEAALALLNKLPQFRNTLLQLSATMDNFHPEVIEEAVGN